MYEVVDAKLKQLLKGGAISTYKEVIKKGAISDVYIIGNCTQNQIRKCIITGIDLKLEKGNAKYIRTATLNYLKEFEKDNAFVSEVTKSIEFLNSSRYIKAYPIYEDEIHTLIQDYYNGFDSEKYVDTDLEVKLKADNKT